MLVKPLYETLVIFRLIDHTINDSTSIFIKVRIFRNRVVCILGHERGQGSIMALTFHRRRVVPMKCLLTGLTPLGHLSMDTRLLESLMCENVLVSK